MQAAGEGSEHSRSAHLNDDCADLAGAPPWHRPRLAPRAHVGASGTADLAHRGARGPCMLVQGWRN